jgi:RNA polymerase-binding transcription factor
MTAAPHSAANHGAANHGAGAYGAGAYGAGDHGAGALPVRPGEDPWSDAELAELRIELEKEAVALRAELGDSQAQIAARLGDAATEAGDDEADTSSKLFEREHELALSNNTRELLEQTEHALARIESGTYGVCESCGKPIGKARLQAFPRATLCVACKQRQERR